MAERRTRGADAARRTSRAACGRAIAGLLAGAVIVAPVRATEAPRPSAAPARATPATPAPHADAASADLELLEFLGSDDVEPELQQYLANREPAKAPASGRSEKK